MKIDFPALQRRLDSLHLLLRIINGGVCRACHVRNRRISQECVLGYMVLAIR